MANTKITADNLAANAVTSASIADNSIGITQLNVSDGTNGQVLTTNGSGTLSFSTISGYTDSDVETYLNTSTIYTDATNNRLGIGQSSPQAYLHVYGTNAEQLRLEGNDEYTYLRFQGTPSGGSSSALGDLGFGNYSGTAIDLNIANRQNGSLTFHTGSSFTQRMTITNDGTMGFGMSPLGTNNGSAFFDGNVSSKDGFMTTGTNLQLIAPSAAATIFVRDNGNESMRIDASGRVLINNSNWEYGQLQVTADPSGTGSFSRGLAVGFQDNASEGDSTGVSFFSKISISGVKWETARIANETRNVTASIFGDLLFYTNHATTFKERMRINSEGAITRAWDNNRYVKRDAKTIGSNFNNPSQTIITVAASGNTNSTIVIKVRVFHAVYASNTGNEHIGVATAMWTGSAWQFQAPTMTKTNGLLTNVGTLSWSGNTLSYTGNRAGNYDNYYIDYEIFNQNPTNSDSQITYGF